MSGRGAEGQAGSRLTALRAAWFSLGVVCVALGLIGAMVPLMPTTVFLIAATACFARSSPRLERRLLDHARFGPPIRAWRNEGAIGRGAKGLACTGMAAGFAIFLLTAGPGLPLAIGVGAALGLCAAFVCTRPAPSEAERAQPSDRP